MWLLLEGRTARGESRSHRRADGIMKIEEWVLERHFFESTEELVALLVISNKREQSAHTCPYAILAMIAISQSTYLAFALCNISLC